MILIIGSEDEAHSVHMLHAVRQAGGEAAFFDSRRFPSACHISLKPGHPEDSWLYHAAGSEGIRLSSIQSVYWRYFYGPFSTLEPADPLREIAMREAHSAIGSMFRNTDCLWVNTPEAIEQHRYKGHQLQLLRNRGIRVPDTLISNRPEDVMAFYEAHQGRVIFKPVAGGAHTLPLTEADLKPERLAELAKAPVQFQERIDGVDVRVYVVGKQLFAAEIQASTLDFRDDVEAPIVPIELPEAVQNDCLAVLNTLGLVFSGVDVRRTPEGEFVFLEGNPSPMFMHFEYRTGYPITPSLVQLLMSGPSKL